MTHRISSADTNGNSFHYRGHHITLDCGVDCGVFRSTVEGLGPKDSLAEIMAVIDESSENTAGEMAKHVIVPYEGGLAAGEIIQAVPPMDSDDDWTFIVDMHPGSTEDDPHPCRTYHLDDMYARGDMNAEIWTDIHRIEAQIRALRQVHDVMKSGLRKPDQAAIEHALEMSEEDRTLPDHFFYPDDTGTIGGKNET